jgi:hypothetical protein
MLVDVVATADEARIVSVAVLDRFRELRLIAGESTGDCVLGGGGYRPGPAVPELYRPREREGRFWEQVTCGVEPQVGKGFNYWALGPVFEGFDCSMCGAVITSWGDFRDGVGAAISEWLDESGPALLACPRCGKARCVVEWHCRPPLGFGNVSFLFWNWPMLASASWRIDIIDVVRKVSGHTIVSTYGHI